MNNSKSENHSPLKFFPIVFGLSIPLWIIDLMIYNNTGKSLFACILFHTMLNVERLLFPRDGIHNPLVDYPNIHYSIIAIAAGIVVCLWGSKTLAHYRYT